MSDWWRQWNPNEVTINSADVDDSWKICVMQGVYFDSNQYNGHTGGRISAVFVVLVTSTLPTMFPLVCKAFPKLRIPEMFFMIARLFGSGVIVSTAFIHLLDPAYNAIGRQSCVGTSGNWGLYRWCPAIMLSAAVLTFIVDAYCDFFADIWYGIHDHAGLEHRYSPHPQESPHASIQEVVVDMEVPDEDDDEADKDEADKDEADKDEGDKDDDNKVDSRTADRIDYYSQFAGFLTLEFGVLFHSVMIGLDLGSSDQYSSLYIALVFHQAFEGLGIGARLVAIPFPPDRRWVPWLCCVAYGLTTPVSIAIGIGVRKTYQGNSFTALIVEGVLDAISAGILMYTGFVELLARDFIFNPRRTKSVWYLSLQLFVFLWGCGLMSLVGKWA